MNENCLAGRACPNCGQTDEVRVAALTWAEIHDDGVADTTDYEYGENSTAYCPACKFTGTWSDFLTD